MSDLSLWPRYVILSFLAVEIRLSFGRRLTPEEASMLDILQVKTYL